VIEMIKIKASTRFSLIFITILYLMISCAREKESRQKLGEEVKAKIGFEANMKEIDDIVKKSEKDVDWLTVYQAA